MFDTITTLRGWRADRNGLSHLADGPLLASCGAAIRPDRQPSSLQCGICVLTYVARREARRAGTRLSELIR